MGVLSEGSAAVMVEVSDGLWGDPGFPGGGRVSVFPGSLCPPHPLQVNCETDFVARTPDFQQLVEMAARGVLGHCQGASGTKVGHWRGGVAGGRLRISGVLGVFGELGWHRGCGGVGGC